MTLRRLMTATVFALALGASITPSSAPARPCADYIDVYNIQTGRGTSCPKAHRVLAALYRKGFNAAAGSRQTVAVGSDRWRCRWTSSTYGPRVRCRNLDGRGSLRGLLSVDY